MLATVKRKTVPLGLSLLKIAEANGKFDLYAAMTLLLLLLYSPDSWNVRIPITIFSILAFIFRPLRSNPKFWFIVAITIFIANFQQWFQIDNHKYLLGYWCLALFCALQTDHPERSIAVTGRLLIGLSFLFAVFWKIISSDYLSNSFFHYSLLIDERFSGLAQGLGGLTDRMNIINHAALDALLNYDSKLEVVQLLSTPGVIKLAGLLTWWTLVIEVLTAISFLSSEGKFISNWRDLFLNLFILSTYSVAPVIGFGWILAVMGIAQCTERFRYMRLFYIFSFITLQVYRLPWSTILRFWFLFAN